ncbi:MAG: LPS export ABC transporter permease LptF [Burkholderiales bacterium]
MIFRRSLVREFAISALGVFLVLLGIMLTTQLVRFLGQAASGAITSQAVLTLMGLAALGYMPILLSLTLFIAVLMVLTRSYHDHEMVVWFSSGLSLTAWARPVLVFAAPLVLTVAVLSLVLTPWAISKSDEFRRQLDNRSDVSLVAPGVFRESKHADRVYFVESVSPGAKTVSNVFVSSTQHGKNGVMVARSGYTQTMPNGDRFLVLVNGRRYEGTPGTSEYKVMTFEHYGIRIESYESTQDQPSPKVLSTPALLTTPTPPNLAELSWRIGLPLSALLLALLAIPLSFVNPRAGRSLNLILAILIYVIYNNVISVAQAWIAEGKIGFATGVWGVHAAMFVILLLLFYRRLTLFSVWRLFR